MTTLDPVIGRLPYPLELIELRPGEALERDGYRDRARSRPTTARRASATRSPRTSGPGRFDLDAARRLGVPEGPMFGLLQHGQAVTLDSGETVAPRATSSAPRGRGARSCSRATPGPCRALFDAAVGADVLVHEATFLEEERERAAETGHTTAMQAARLARTPACTCSR